ncbi:MAG: hypothetical protein ACFFDI_04205 [Promethearchaeota archaeon]
MISYIERLRFYDGRERPIEKERLFEFEMKAVINRYYSGRTIDTKTLLENLGPFQIDYTNYYHYWSEETPDIDSRSARVFML